MPKDLSPNVCVITMVYNESFNVPLWIKYYSRQVGKQNLLIIDNDSTDESVQSIRAVPHLRYPRTTFSDVERSEFISQLASSLLTIYDYVIYVDADEFIVADPEKYTGLVDFLEKNPAEAHTCVGFNLYERVDVDSPYDDAKPLFSQRSSLNFITSMCKTSIVSKPVSWSGGFHAANIAPNFSGLKLIHIKSSVNDFAKQRLAITREVEWRTAGKAGGHQRISDERFSEISTARSKRPLEEFTEEKFEELKNLLVSNVKPIKRGRGDTLYHLESPGIQWYVKLPQKYEHVI